MEEKKELKPVDLHYWPIRGLIQPTLYLCEYLEIPYNFVEKNDREKWFSSKAALQNGGLDFPNLPYIKDPNNKGKMLSESQAINFYVVKLSGRSEMLPNYDNIPEYMMFLGVVADINGGVTSIAYNSKDIEDCR